MTELKISQGDAKTPDEFCALLRAHTEFRQLAISLEEGVFPITPTREWGDSNDINQNPGFRFGPEWTLDGGGKATIKIITDDTPIDGTPLAAIRSTELRFDAARLNQHTPDEMWAWLPRGQAVRNLTIDVGFREALARWVSTGVMLRLSAVALAGHQAVIENVHVTNYGAYLYEGFPLYIQGAYGQYDRNLLAQLDPATHIFDSGLADAECSHIIDCTTDGIVEQSNIGDQVSVHFIGGSIGERTPGEWVNLFRAFSYQSRNRTVGGGSNNVQGHTAYQTLRFLIDHNKTEGAIGYYGDYYKSKGGKFRGNEFGTAEKPCYHGVQLNLSPTAVGQNNAADEFSHEDFDIDGSNKIVSRAANVKLNSMAAEYMKATGHPVPDTRYIKNIAVDINLSLEKDDASTVVRTGVPLAVLESRSGCRFNPFR